MKAVLSGHTSDQMRRDAMTTEYELLNKQIKDQEKMFHDSRELSTQLTLRTSEVGLRLKILETAMQAAEQLKITTVSAQNRFAVVDPGIPAGPQPPGPVAARCCQSCDPPGYPMYLAVDRVYACGNRRSPRWGAPNWMESRDEPLNRHGFCWQISVRASLDASRDTE